MENSRVAIHAAKMMMNCNIQFGTIRRKPKKPNTLTTITKMNTIMYASENSGTHIIFTTSERMEILEKYSAKIGAIAKVVTKLMAKLSAITVGTRAF